MLLLPSLASAEILTASWYDTASLIKEGTIKQSETPIMANGQIFNDYAPTCATRLYPFNTWLRITNIKNNQRVLVKVTDRIGKRFAKTKIDLTRGAFEQIGNLKQGLLRVKVEQIR